MITRWGLGGGMRLLIILGLPNLKKILFISECKYQDLGSRGHTCVCHVSIELLIKGPSGKSSPGF